MSSFPSMPDGYDWKEEDKKMAGMKSLVLIRGLPGSGKTTLARAMASAYRPSGIITMPRCAHFEEDMFFTITSGKYVYATDKRHEAEEWCRSRTHEAMRDDVNLVIVSNRFIRLYELELYHLMAKSRGYNVQEIVCKGNFPNEHGWTDDDLSRFNRHFQYRPLTSILGNGPMPFIV